MLRSSLALIAIASALAATAANAAMPTQVGQCVTTTIKEMGSRLEGDPSSGSAIVYANDASQVSYDVEPAVRGWRAGDRVTLCLIRLPTGCPPGDTRGSVYKVTNPRVGTSWTEADSAPQLRRRLSLIETARSGR